MNPTTLVARHWLRFCPSWKSFKANRTTLNDACRYFTREDFLAGYLHKDGNNLGHIMLLYKGKLVVRFYGASPKEMLTRIQDWAEANKGE
jgi:hypothetical protein